jgi:hypothetical protein
MLTTTATSMASGQGRKAMSAYLTAVGSGTDLE